MSRRKPIIQDPISALIREQDVRIKEVFASKEANRLVVVLNNGSLSFPLDQFKGLARASKAQLNKYALLPDGAGVEWPALDEHLSLRGFLIAAMRELIGQRSGAKVLA